MLEQFSLTSARHYQICTPWNESKIKLLHVSELRSVVHKRNVKLILFWHTVIECRTKTVAHYRYLPTSSQSQWQEEGWAGTRRMMKLQLHVDSRYCAQGHYTQLHWPLTRPPFRASDSSLRRCSTVNFIYPCGIPRSRVQLVGRLTVARKCSVFYDARISITMVAAGRELTWARWIHFTSSFHSDRYRK
jgi:hypothetical protein